MNTPLLDYDWVRGVINADLPDAARDSFDGNTETHRDGSVVCWKGSLGPDLDVLYYPERSQIWVSGSPHKLARGESVGVFGPAEVRNEFVEAVSAALHLPTEVVVTARLSRFDLAANLFVDHAPREYLRIMAPPPRMKEVGSGPGSRAFKHTRCGLVLYDKAQKLIDLKRRHLIPPDWAGSNVLRLEVRFKPRYEFKRAVTVGDLCDHEFYAVAVRQWQRRIRSIPLVTSAWPVPVTETKGEMVEALAGEGLQATGGAAEMLARIDRSRRLGLVEPRNASRQRTWVSFQLDGRNFKIEPPLAQEFRDACDGAVQASLALAQRVRVCPRTPVPAGTVGAYGSGGRTATGDTMAGVSNHPVSGAGGRGPI